jgi:hypothetical protein
MHKKKCCNLCGKDLNLFDKQENFSIHKEIGYGSEHDGDTLDLQICCECMDEIIKKCVLSPITEW